MGLTKVGRKRRDNRERRELLINIRKHCLWCCLGQRDEIKKCSTNDCPIWNYRLGKGGNVSPKLLLNSIRAKCIDCGEGKSLDVRNCIFNETELGNQSEMDKKAKNTTNHCWLYRYRLMGRYS